MRWGLVAFTLSAAFAFHSMQLRSTPEILLVSNGTCPFQSNEEVHTTIRYLLKMIICHFIRFKNFHKINRLETAGIFFLDYWSLKKLRGVAGLRTRDEVLGVPDLSRNVIPVDVGVLEEHVQTSLVLGQRVTGNSGTNRSFVMGENRGSLE